MGQRRYWWELLTGNWSAHYWRFLTKPEAEMMFDRNASSHGHILVVLLKIYSAFAKSLNAYIRCSKWRTKASRQVSVHLTLYANTLRRSARKMLLYAQLLQFLIYIMCVRHHNVLQMVLPGAKARPRECAAHKVLKMTHPPKTLLTNYIQVISCVRSTATLLSKPGVGDFVFKCADV